MINASLPALRRALDEKQISSVELAGLFLDRIEAANPTLNAFITIDRDGALTAAREADARIAAGTAGALTGIPLAHKDVFCTEGVLTTCGSKMLANFVSPYDAHVVSLLKQAGAVSLGKTNMDEFAMGSSNENSHFGPARNPWNPAHVPGGSSGGSAAAVAARLVPIATGTDTGGSVRQPAAFCGVTGIKPTYGVVSRYGMVAYASSLDQGGAFGASAEDCALLLSAMSGFDPRDSTSLERPAEDYSAALAAQAGEKPLAGLRIGLPREFFAEGMSDDVRAAVDAALEQYRALGASTVDVSLPNAKLAIPAYYVIAPAEASSNLSRFDGVRYGHRAASYGDLNDMYCKSRAEGFGAEVKRRILVGTYVLSHGYYDAYYLQAQKLRRLIAEDFKAALTQCDLIAGPTTPTTAWALGAMGDDPVQMYLADIYTIAVNLAGLPGLSHPCGFGAGGLPVGLQLIGNYFAEGQLLSTAHRYQQASDWHLRRPDGAA
ncbi:Asp-tRNA(Asn)/Glu-tRNA(Gln) amidotransferase subunit GatA [Azoarcus communis]|uniref:Glutamyl-tRNA(Gln) amidotransferase subunit A n=1 Tax=Parazoarcus communis SWub3 = DSM 12120 TaxID=1121029 RepID=A0A323UZG0_9RHOO|nr:Asp-tRNA(Asn)/Glu-tRNA(Gln) amidotransferase subunit GatA [Parazoarcus communis]NMG47725.1 Asp-tRNA(Asn)/Glu-tRNA(Gln) amidotransferase subunit GatA [Parazoarcus communis]NMG68774.1 Asp-tRNA(Asn)/Glu-tRNA(Gln) amidotransferase subunit GatA [Parazoarcus communis SWub3 = DSM 12120]PZA17895.1 Asp-tRNA(Asn)/Glu-tRNA(Gln) amidotransferase GatCAB subunit A [Azoarcus communis] [Parazoarcus communis SWub3 = DSM 12120]